MLNQIIDLDEIEYAGRVGLVYGINVRFKSGNYETVDFDDEESMLDALQQIYNHMDKVKNIISFSI